MLNARTARRPTVEEDVAEALALLRRQSEQRARAAKDAQGDKEGIASREMRLMSAAGARDGTAAGAGFAPLAGAMANGGGTAHARFWPGVNEVAAGRPVPAARVMPDRSAPLQPQFIPGLGELTARRVQWTAASQSGAGGVSPIAAASAAGTSLSARTGGGRNIPPHANAPAVAGQRTRDPQLWRPARMQAPEIGPPMDPGTGTSSTLQGSRRLREAMPGVADAIEPEPERAPARRRLDPSRPGSPIVEGVTVTRRAWGAEDPNIDGMNDMDLRNVDEIIFHHTGDEVTPRDVQNLHRRGQDENTFLRDLGARVLLRRPPYRWDDVGYHYMIAEDGTIYEGRNVHYEGNSSDRGGANRNSVAVGFLGDYTDRPLTRQQLASARALILRLQQAGGREDWDFSTHGEYDERKRNEVRGGFAQLRRLEQQLAADRGAIARAPASERQGLTARLIDAARREAQAAREDALRDRAAREAARRAAQAAREEEQRAAREAARRRIERERYGPYGR